MEEAPGGDETLLNPGEYATALLEIPHLEDEGAELISMASSWTKYILKQR